MPSQTDYIVAKDKVHGYVNHWLGSSLKLEYEGKKCTTSTLWPANSLSRQAALLTSEASTILLPPSPLRLLPAGTTVAGRELHPLKMYAFHGAREEAPVF